MQNLPLVDVFSNPYEIWRMRSPTHTEIVQLGLYSRIKEQLISKITNSFEAATHTLLNRGNTQLDEFIENKLNTSPAYKQMRNMMPSQTPKKLADFQNKHQSIHFDDVSNIIKSYGHKPAAGQILYHGGFWSGAIGQSIVTTRPLSTSFSPHMACENAEWRGKAYDSGELHLMILRVVNPKTSVFCFRINGTSKGHEKEILFATGANLTLRNKMLIKADGLACKSCNIYAGRVLEKRIPFYILEMDIS